jgi:hypothetical protein
MPRLRRGQTADGREDGSQGAAHRVHDGGHWSRKALVSGRGSRIRTSWVASCRGSPGPRGPVPRTKQAMRASIRSHACRQPAQECTHPTLACDDETNDRGLPTLWARASNGIGTSIQQTGALLARKTGPIRCVPAPIHDDGRSDALDDHRRSLHEPPHGHQCPRSCSGCAGPYPWMGSGFRRRAAPLRRMRAPLPQDGSGHPLDALDQSHAYPSPRRTRAGWSLRLLREKSALPMQHCPKVTPGAGVRSALPAVGTRNRRCPGRSRCCSRCDRRCTCR